MAEKKIEITPSEVLTARTYMPVAAKEAACRGIAFACAEPVDIHLGLNNMPLPGAPFMVRENRMLRQMFQMGLLAWYLKRPYAVQRVKMPDGNGGTEERELAYLMDMEDFDLWASSHVVNQLERLKKSGDKAVSNKIYDLLYDYKCLEAMITAAIRDEMTQRNDPVGRAVEWLSGFASEEAAAAVMESLTRTKADLDAAIDAVDAEKAKSGGLSNG